MLVRMSPQSRPLVTELTSAEIDQAASLLDHELGGRVQVRAGEAVDVLALPGLGAWYGDRLVGVVTWQCEEGRDRAELAVLVVDSGHRGRGIGGALTEASVAAARDAGAAVMWLLTTNDNLDALRLYQRHGFRLARLRVGGVDESRLVKPTIPTTGAYGIPLHDELILERPL